MRPHLASYDLQKKYIGQFKILLKPINNKPRPWNFKLNSWNRVDHDFWCSIELKFCQIRVEFRSFLLISWIFQSFGLHFSWSRRNFTWSIHLKIFIDEKFMRNHTNLMWFFAFHANLMTNKLKLVECRGDHSINFTLKIIFCHDHMITHGKLIMSATLDS